MLGWTLYSKIAYKVGWLFKFRWRAFPSPYLGISRFFTIFESNWLNHSINFSERKSLAVCQSFSSSIIFFSLRLAKYFLFSFLKKDTHQFLCFMYECLLCSFQSLKNLFLNLAFCIMTWDKVLFINGLLFPEHIFFFWRAVLIYYSSAYFIKAIRIIWKVFLIFIFV